MSVPPTISKKEQNATPRRLLDDDDEELKELKRVKANLQEKKRLKEEISKMQEEVNGGEPKEKEKLLLEFMARTNKIAIFPHLAKFDAHIALIDKFRQRYAEGAEEYQNDLERRFINKLKIGAVSPGDALVLQYLFATHEEKLFLIENLLTNKNNQERVLLHNTKIWQEKNQDFETNRAKTLLSLNVPLIRDLDQINEKILDIEERSNVTGGADNKKNGKKKFRTIFDIGGEEEICGGSNERYTIATTPEGLVDLTEVRDIIWQITQQINELQQQNQAQVQQMQQQQLQIQQQQQYQQPQYFRSHNNFYNRGNKQGGYRGRARGFNVKEPHKGRERFIAGGEKPDNFLEETPQTE